jgi:hypothetical protein
MVLARSNGIFLMGKMAFAHFYLFFVTGKMHYARFWGDFRYRLNGIYPSIFTNFEQNRLLL